MKRIIIALILTFTSTTFAIQVVEQSGSRLEIYDSPVFLEDIGPQMSPVSDSIQTYSGECYGIQSCGDYFDVPLTAGQRLLISFCPSYGGSYDFDTGLGIWDTANIGAGTIVTNDDSCGLGSQLIFRPIVSGTYRILIGTYGATYGGAYTLAYGLVKERISIGSQGTIRIRGGFLVLPTMVAPPAEECITWQEDEGKLIYSWGDNAIYVCAPDFGGWNRIDLVPPNP